MAVRSTGPDQSQAAFTVLLSFRKLPTEPSKSMSYVPTFVCFVPLVVAVMEAR